MKCFRNMRPPAVDYRKLHIGNIVSDEFSHLKLLLFWPLFGMAFVFVERFYQVDRYYPVHCFLDDKIPFIELFVIPYLFWFIFLMGMHLYTLLYNIHAFRKMMRFIMITYTVAIVIYLLFPTCQELRPSEFERDNMLTRFMAEFYTFDTNTNVCPSIHVIGSLAVVFTSWHIDTFQSPGWRRAFNTTGLMICLSTVFLKQHSVIDVICALPICLTAYYFAFRRKSMMHMEKGWEGGSMRH